MPFGFGPHLLLPGWLSNKKNTNRTIEPINGISIIKYHQALLPVSCNLRAINAKPGIMVINPQRIGANGITIKRMLMMMLNNTKYQYSLRRALPLKLA